MLPLRQWRCDQCGQVIACPEHGWLEWLDPNDGTGAHGFRIVHHSPASPLGRGGCYAHTRHDDRQDVPLARALGSDGLAYLLKFVSAGPASAGMAAAWEVRSAAEFHEIVRRLHLPFYEEARQHFERARGDGWFLERNPGNAFAARSLQDLIQVYGDAEPGRDAGVPAGDAAALG